MDLVIVALANVTTFVLGVSAGVMAARYRRMPWLTLVAAISLLVVALLAVAR